MTVVLAVINKRRAFVELEEPSDENLKVLKRALARCQRRPYYDRDAEWWMVRTECLKTLREQGIEVKVVK